MKSFALSITLFVASIDALSFNPKPTPSDEGTASMGQGWTPKPTQKTEISLNDLRRRAARSSQEFLGYAAPDNTCGFIEGNLGNPLTCDPSQNCAVVSHSASVGGLILCCDNPNSCFWFSSCLDSTAVSQTSLCGDLCQNDNFLLKCTESSAPYCAGFSMNQYAASAYSCDSFSASAFQFVQSTYNGEHAADFTSWVPVYDGETAFSSSTSSSSSSSSTTSSSSSTSSASAAAATSTSTHKSSSTNVGAIAGGVVGGLAVVGAVVCGLVWMCLRNRRRRNGNTNNNAAGGTNPINQYPPPMAQHQSSDAQQWQQQQQHHQQQANTPYAPYPDPSKQGFQQNTYQQQPLLAADYNHPHGHPEGLSPPTSPAPQYSAADRQSMAKPELNSPVAPPTHGHDGAQEVEARPAVPHLGRDGTPVFEVQ